MAEHACHWCDHSLDPLNLPPLTQEPLTHVDATPDDDYALRILRAHRQNTECRWEVYGLGEERRRVFDMMNEAARRRASLLDAAIAALANHRGHAEELRRVSQEQARDFVERWVVDHHATLPPLDPTLLDLVQRVARLIVACAERR